MKNKKFGAKPNVSSPGALSSIGGQFRGSHFFRSKVTWPELQRISIRRTRSVDLG